MRMSIRDFLLATVSVALMSTAAAAQQQAVPPPPPPPGTQLDEITVTATRQEERAVDTMAGVSVVPRSELQQQQPQRIGTVLSQMPGVTTQENPNDPATAVNIRGMQDFGRVAVTIDGARQNFQRSGHNANGAFFLDPAFVRSIDVTRGPVANIYGSGAIGGVVSFETLDPSDILRPGEQIAGEISGTGLIGRQGGGFGSGLLAFRNRDLFEGMLGVSLRNLGDYKDGAGNRILDSGQDVKSAIGKFVVDPGNGHKLKIGGQYQEYDFSNGPGTATSPRRSNDVTTKNIFARYTFSRPDNDWIDLSATVYSTQTDTFQKRLSGTPAQIGQERFFKIRTSGFDIHNTTRAQFGAASLALTYGADFFRDQVSTADAFGNGDETTPSGRRDVYGGFAQAHFKWSMIDLIAAARYDAYELSGGGNRSNGSRVSPKLTLGVTPFQGIQFYATYAEGYRAPSITETLVDGLHPPPAAFVFVPNPNLKPEVGRTIEAGINLKFDDVFSQGDRVRGKLSVFRNDVTNFIDGVFVDPGAPCGAPIPGACNDAFYTYQNVSRARLQGVEGELVYDARRWFASIAGSSVRGDDRTSRQPLQSVYPDKLALGAGLRFFDEKLVLGGRLTMVAAQRRLPAAALSTASRSYALVDLYASYAITPDARAFVTVENVGDVRYRRYRDSDNSPGLVAKIGFTTRIGG